jgi:hypothetical protein
LRFGRCFGAFFSQLGELVVGAVAVSVGLFGDDGFGGEVLVAEVEDGEADLFGLLGDAGADAGAAEGDRPRPEVKTSCASRWTSKQKSSPSSG